MEHPFIRTEWLLGKEAMQKIYKSKVAIFGVGGVGSYVVEGLVRAGVGSFKLIDHDTVSISNINRQIPATTNTVGRKKIEILRERIQVINPKAQVDIHDVFYLPDTADQIDLTDCDYVIDAIDTVTGKLQIIQNAVGHKVPVISSMGTGNKLDPTQIEVTDIYKTTMCPLAKVMRKELRKRDIKKLKVVYSREKPVKVQQDSPGSVSFVPSVAGLIIAGEVIKDLAAL